MKLASENRTTRTPAPAAQIVDAHVHFWEPATLEYPWLKTLPALDRSFLPADYAAAVSELPVENCVIVEGNCLPTDSENEVRLFERLARADPRIAGIVAFADLTEPTTLGATFDCLTSIPSVRGIRQNIQGQRRGFALQRAFVHGVREVGRREWVFDLCVTHDQLDEAIALVEQCPGTRFVLDHCGKPDIRAGAQELWRRDVARLASHENVCCKISGLLTEADVARWREEDLLPYAAHVVECFGTERVLYGSDWPVLTLAGDYKSWFDFTARLADSWSEDQRRSFYAGNATREYRL
jgi:L-fuconolactonase